jgi:hypothetical protein
MNSKASRAGSLLTSALAPACSKSRPGPVTSPSNSSSAPAFKNFARPLAALDEMHRVLNNGGMALIIDLRKDFSRDAVNAYVRERSAIAGAFIKLTFNTMLKKRAYTKDSMAELVARSRFGQGDIRLDPMGFKVWLRK